MKLNPDCIRDILLLIERNEQNSSYLYEQDSRPAMLRSYTNSEIMYHASQCSKHGFIEGFSANDSETNFFVVDITPAGHEFLANIRNDTFFNRVKSICKDIGVSSLKDVAHVASLATTTLIKSYFKIL